MAQTQSQQRSYTVVEQLQEFYGSYYREEIATFAQQYPKDKQSVYIEARDLYRFEPDLYDDWLNKPGQMRAYAEEALAQFDLPAEVNLEGANVRLTDSHDYLPTHGVTDINSSDIGNLVAVRGQLGRITGKSPRLTTAAWECQRDGTIHNIPQTRTEVQEPHECRNCERQGPFTLSAGKSEFIDQRKIKLEEPIEERAQARGESIAIYVEDDLCEYGPGETTLPDHAGEQATIIGTVNVDESQFTGRGTDPESDIWIDAVAIVFESDDAADIDIESHREEFETLAASDDAVDIVAESIAPSLHAEKGDDLYTARRACAAWLFNAYRVDPPGSGSKRGDLHMCLIGDPGTGKSTLMGYLDDIAPKSEYRTGTGLSEVGLTAAAVQEEFAGQTEWTLQPGVLPRADGGHCLIDEIDGVVDENTKAIHDALEGEQMVKADKAGIKADLPTRTALLAGGNPTYTRFNRFEPITNQIDLDPALFDRMDLVFALQDIVDEQRDATKAAHALDAWDDLTKAEVAEMQNTDSESDGETVDPEVSKETLRAWIAHARREVFPTLTEAAKDTLQDYYVEVRDLNDGHSGDSDEDNPVPATMRTLEAGIRLAISFARLRLSDEVTTADAERAIDLSRDVVGLNFDPETGEFDADRHTQTGKPQADRVEDVLNLLEEHGKLTFDELAERVDARESKIEHEIEQLKRKGVVYEPQTGVFEPT